MSEMNTQEPPQVRTVLASVARVWSPPGVAVAATQATLQALKEQQIDVYEVDSTDQVDQWWSESFVRPEDHQWPVVQIEAGEIMDYDLQIERWYGHQPGKIAEWGPKMANRHELEIGQASAPVLEALYLETRGQTEAANRRRAVHADQTVLYLENLVELAVEQPWLSPDEGVIPVYKLVGEHDGDLKSTVADPRLDEAVSAMVQSQDKGLLDGDGNPAVTTAEILSFVRASVAVEAEALARDRVAAVTNGAAKAAELGQVMHFGVEGHSREDNARRLEAAQAINAVLMRDGLNEPTEPFALTSVIEHGGNLSEVVNDPGLYQDLRDNLNLPFIQAETGEDKSIDYLDHANNRDYFDSVVSSLQLKEQYGTDTVLQKAMEAASFASSQQKFPVAHTAAGEGKTTKASTTKTPVERQRQQPGLAR